MRALLFEVGGGARCDGGDVLTCCIGAGELPRGRNRPNPGPTRSPTLHPSTVILKFLQGELDTGPSLKSAHTVV